MNLDDVLRSVGSLLSSNPLLERLFFASLELAVLSLVAAALIRTVRVRSPRVALLLWAVVLVKPVVSLSAGSPLAILIEIPPPEMAAPDPGLELPDSDVPGAPIAGVRGAAGPSVPPRLDGSRLPDGPMPVAAAESGGSLVSGTDSGTGSAAAAGTAGNGPPAGWVPALLVGAWLSGAFLLLAYHLSCRIRLRRVLGSARRPSDATTSRYRALAAGIGVKRVPTLLLTDRLETPAITGLVRPVVLMPSWLADGDGDPRFEWCVRHELTHWKWLDPLAVLARDLTTILFYFHPATWWARRRLTESMELACDRAVLRTAEDGPRYAEKLYEILVTIRERRGIAVAGGLYATRTQIGKRIAALLDTRFCAVPQLSALSLLGTVLFAALSLSLGGTFAESPGSQDEKGTAGTQNTRKSDETKPPEEGTTEGEPADAGSEKDPDAADPPSRAWHVLRQWNAGPLLVGLPERLHEAALPSGRKSRIWTDREGAGRVVLDIRVERRGRGGSERSVPGKILVGFFREADWSSAPLHVRELDGPGARGVRGLAPGRYRIGAMIGPGTDPDALGVHRTWPSEVVITREKVPRVEVLLSREFERALGSYHYATSRADLGLIEKRNPERALDGRVTGPGGEGIPHVLITLHEAKPEGARRYAMAHAGTDRTGYFYLDEMTWPYRVVVERRECLPKLLGWRTQTIAVPRVFEGRRTVDFRFDAFPEGKAALAGRVVDQDGQPIEEFHLQVALKVDWGKLWDENRSGEDTAELRSFEYRIPFVSEDGRFEIGGLPAGAFTVRAIPFDTTAYEPFAFVTEVELEEDEAANIEVRVKAKDPGPDPGPAGRRRAGTQAGARAPGGARDRKNTGDAEDSEPPNDPKNRDGAAAGTTSPESGKSFGRVVSRALTAERDEWMLDLDTGKTHGPVVIGGDSSDPAGMDISVPYFKTTEGHRATAVASIGGLRVLPVENAAWDSRPERVLAAELAAPGEPVVGGGGGPSRLAGPKDRMPRTFLFRTDRGNRGLLQVVRFIDEPGGVRIRYKLLVDEEREDRKGGD